MHILFRVSGKPLIWHSELLFGIFTLAVGNALKKEGTRAGWILPPTKRQVVQKILSYFENSSQVRKLQDRSFFYCSGWGSAEPSVYERVHVLIIVQIYSLVLQPVRIDKKIAVWTLTQGTYIQATDIGLGDIWRVFWRAGKAEPALASFLFRCLKQRYAIVDSMTVSTPDSIDATSSVIFVGVLTLTVGQWKMNPLPWIPPNAPPPKGTPASQIEVNLVAPTAHAIVEISHIVVSADRWHMVLRDVVWKGSRISTWRLSWRINKKPTTWKGVVQT